MTFINTLQKYATAMTKIAALIREHREKCAAFVKRSGEAGASGDIEKARAKLITKIEKAAAHALQERVL